MKNKPLVQTDFVVNITTNFQRHAPEDLEIQGSPEIMSVWDFISDPSIQEKIQQFDIITDKDQLSIYKNLFALIEEEHIVNQNDYYCYFSPDACEMILNHLDLFISGIDFKHLPSGFFLTKHPEFHQQQILHYSPYLAEKKPQKNPLAIVLSKKPETTEYSQHVFQGHQAHWYEYLRSHMNGFCTEAELKKAFIYFSNKMQELNLEFFETDFLNLEHPFNPIVVLGRWYTILTQEHLDPLDVQEQFIALPKLDFTRGYSPLRAITQYAQSRTPCRFIIPEMFIAGHYASIKRDDDFWIHLAFQNQKNSIGFYRQGLAKIEKLDIYENTKLLLKEMLIKTTTQLSHLAKSSDEEALELHYWQAFCSMIANFPVPPFVDPKIVREQFVQEFANINPQPNIHFFYSIVQYCQPITRNTCALVIQGKTLLDLSSQLNECIQQFDDSFYLGSRFYFVNDKWLYLDIKKYTELQHQVLLNPDLHMFAAYLSTFNIQTIEDLEGIKYNFEALNISNLENCIEFFKDVIQPLNQGDLKKICDDISQLSKHYSKLEMLKYVEDNFARYFAEDYFEKQRDMRLGFNALIRHIFGNLGFTESQKTQIINIYSTLSKNDPHAVNMTALHNFKASLLKLKQKLNTNDFNFLLTKLLSNPYQLSNTSELQELFEIIGRTADIQDFKQIYFRNLIEKCHDASITPRIIKFIALQDSREPVVSLNPLLIDDFVSGVVLNSSNLDIEERVHDALLNIEGVLRYFPHLQEYLLAAFTNIPEKRTLNYDTYLGEFITTLRKILELFPVDPVNKESSLEIYKLFAHFHQTPVLMTRLVAKISSFDELDDKQFLIQFINQLMSSGQDSSELVTFIEDLSPANLEILKIINHPPYPNIDTISQWINEGELEKKFEVFSSRPFGERQLANAFNLETFKKQKELFIGVDKDFFSEELAQTLDEQLKNNRKLRISELRTAFLVLKQKIQLSDEDKLQLLCICIEVLARTTWQLDKNGKISQECNTTQVMALLAMLHNPNTKLISEIGTGEGKSRIKMVLAACQIAQGKTVDFMTSDIQLAERDFISYQAFFSALNIQTSLISLHTPPELYQYQGVNFSDNSQLILLRNRSDIHHRPHDFLDKTPENRCLLMDEVDKFMHDRAADSYNYASQSETLKSFVWIYPYLVNFVRDKQEDFKPENLIDQFIEYVSLHETVDENLAFLTNLNTSKPQQIITWLHAAHTALQLRCDRDYKISGPEEHQRKLIRDVDGFKRFTREIIVTDTGRPVKDASFAHGVHQCLCVIENQKIGAHAEDFIILPENETQRSSYPVSFMAQYQAGKIYGASGTSRYEGRIDNAVINYEKYSYMVVPRHKQVVREDKNICLAKDASQQIDFLKRSLREKLTEKPARPVLLICENDEQSQEIFNQLNQDTELKQLMRACTRIEASSEKETELDAIKNAGNPGVVTISTVGMFGRGVDIHADNLFVSALYVPSIEDEKQIKGRTGRAGKPGEYRMIANLEALPFPIQTHYHIEHDIQSMQKMMALQAIQREEVAKLYADFQEYITQVFLQESQKINQERPENYLQFLQTWLEFLNDMQKDWDRERENLMSLLKSNQFDAFKESFSQFTTQWNEKAPFQTEHYEVTNVEKVCSSLQAQHQFFKPGPKVIKRQEKYDISDDGQARIYTSLFAREIATLRGERRWFADYHAWREGRGDLFPDLMATLRGERLLFANLWATLAHLLELIINWVNGEQNEETNLVPAPRPL